MKRESMMKPVTDQRAGHPEGVGDDELDEARLERVSGGAPADKVLTSSASSIVANLGAALGKLATKG